MAQVCYNWVNFISEWDEPHGFAELLAWLYAGPPRKRPSCMTDFVSLRPVGVCAEEALAPVAERFLLTLSEVGMLKTETVRAKCTRDERKALELIAAKERRLLSETLREVIREAAQRRGVWPPERAQEGESKHATQ